MKKLAIFDMDGTLFNTNDINYYAYKEALEKYNVSIDYDYYCNFCNGRHYTVFLPGLVQNDENKIKDIHELKKKYYSKYLNKVKINTHLFNIIESIKNDYNIALVTTASKKNTIDILEYSGKKDLFDLIITSEDIEKPKPNPEGFLKAIKHFKANKEDTIIFEDSSVGIEAALQTDSNIIKIEKF